MTAPRAVTLRFYEELNDFLPPSRRKREYQREIFLSPAVKDIVEAEGVPHAEVDLILVNGESVGFDHRLKPGDRVAVYPVFEGLDVTPLQRLRPTPLRDPRFVLDVHLGTLARRLRLLGFDSCYRNDLDDHEVVGISRREHRIILTRDVGLLKHGAVTHGYWVRSKAPDRQVVEVLERCDLARLAKPFSRCMACNGPLEVAQPEAVADRVPPGVRARFARFYRCPACGRVYWEGSHYRHMRRWLARHLTDLPHE